MTTNFKQCIELLSDGKFHSGEALGESLGITRGAIWKIIRKIEDYGLVLHSLPGRGYCVPGGLDLLQKQRIFTYIDEKYRDHMSELEVLDKVDSTNNYLLHRQARKGEVIFAEYQTKGRGRSGKTWVSPYGVNLYCSLAWQFPGGSAQLVGLSLVVGIAVVRALNRYGLKHVQLKWPNDVFYQGQKLAGILVDIAGDISELCQAIIGIGLNVASKQHVDTAIDQSWIDMNTIMQKPADRNQLAGLIVNELIAILLEFEQTGLSAFKQEWQQHDMLLGQDVIVTTKSQSFHGHVLGIDEFGYLIVATAKGEKKLSSGKVSVKLTRSN